jgi:2',3'-cyclic-nucleotide 2'-phosphodiesterase (5'-nucleotidase family)
MVKTCLTLCAVAPALLSCIAYNVDCSHQIANPDETLTFLGAETPVAEEVTRTRETFIGNTVADAFLTFVKRQGLGGAGVDVAVANAGSIREDGLCQQREVLRAGRLKRKTLRDVLPFDDELVLVEVTEVQLENALEHAVARLNGERPAGAFLQVAGMGFTVNCANPPESIAGTTRTPGQRIERIWISPSGKPAECVEWTDTDPKELVRSSTPCRWIYPPDDPGHAGERASADETVRIAMTSFLADGGDGFRDFARAAGETFPKRFELSETRIAYQVVADHLVSKGKDSASNPLPVTLDAAPRIERRNCIP